MFEQEDRDRDSDHIFERFGFKFRSSLINFFYFCSVGDHLLLFSTEISSGLKKKKKEFEFNEILIEGKCLWRKYWQYWNKNLDSLISRPWPELLPITVVSIDIYIVTSYFYHFLIYTVGLIQEWSTLFTICMHRFNCYLYHYRDIQFFLLYFLFYSILFYSYNWDDEDDTKYWFDWIWMNSRRYEFLLYIYLP